MNARFAFLHVYVRYVPLVIGIDVVVHNHTPAISLTNVVVLAAATVRSQL